MLKLLQRLVLGAMLFAALVIVGGLAGWITVRVMTGKGSVEVPHLIGAEVPAAINRLDEVGLRVSIEGDEEHAFDDHIPVGFVLRQTPSAGSFRKRDSKVRVVLSLGPRAVYVPRVVGEPAIAAQSRIQEAGLRVGAMIYVPSKVVPEGVVVDQEPARLGTASDNQISLLISSGPAARKFVMPDLIGKQSLRIRAALELTGFRVRTEAEVYDGVPDDTIVRQKPLSGYLVSVADPVWIWASRPSRPETP